MRLLCKLLLLLVSTLILCSPAYTEKSRPVDSEKYSDSCSDAYVSEKRKKKAVLPSKDVEKPIEVKISLKDVKVVAFSSIEYEAGNKKLKESKVAQAEKKEAEVSRNLAGEMVFVKGGCFTMGCGNWTDNCEDEEKPVHKVCVDDFYIDKTEVTQKAYMDVVRNNPSILKGCDDCPVERVTWNDAQSYCEKVGSRLPTEAEWEYAARSGGKREKYAGATENPDAYAWYSRNSGGKSHPVGQKEPNGLGLYDMGGNVYEWVSDWSDKNYYRSSPMNNPKGPSGGMSRVMRGGSWGSEKKGIRSSARGWYVPAGWYRGLGFRCAGTP
jgi:formylglycine-generating enzyme required for sulfatase activity